MTFPVIHDNGTSKKRLAAAYEAAFDALNAAADKLKETAPNARDYYPQGGDAYSDAAAEHRSRMVLLAGLMEELDDLIGHCNKG